MNNQYKRMKIALHMERHREAIEILETVQPYWRSNYIAEAVAAYHKIQNSKTSRGNRKVVSKTEKSLSVGNGSEIDDDFFGV